MVELALLVIAMTAPHGLENQSPVEAPEAAKETLSKKTLLELALGVDLAHVRTDLFIGSVIIITDVALLLAMGAHLDNAIEMMVIGETDELLATKWKVEIH